VGAESGTTDCAAPEAASTWDNRIKEKWFRADMVRHGEKAARD